MASEKKQSEGIALLSMYNDDGDDDMEDAEEDEEDNQEIDMRHEQNEDAAAGGFAAEVNLTATDADRMAGVDSSNEGVADEVSTPAEKRRFGTPTPQRVNTNMVISPPQDQRGVAVLPSDSTRSGRGKLTIVDYGHDEVAMSPEPEEGEIGGSVRVMYGDQLNLTNVFRLQRKINKFLEYKKAGKSFNAEVRNRKNYRNPDFLLHAVRYQEIDQIGSCFSKDVFDPHGYDSSDFYDEIEADMRRESERKEHEKKKAQKMEFIAEGTQPGIVAAGAPRISLPVAGGSAVAASGLVPPIADSINRDGRQNKKSKWDKVDGDRKNPLPSVGQDSVSTVGAHAAILSAVNAGSGYMLFV
nr:SAP30-binding protein-like [Arachis hypogaea]